MEQSRNNMIISASSQVFVENPYDMLLSQLRQYLAEIQEYQVMQLKQEEYKNKQKQKERLKKQVEQKEKQQEGAIQQSSTQQQQSNSPQQQQRINQQIQRKQLEKQEQLEKEKAQSDQKQRIKAKRQALKKNISQRIQYLGLGEKLGALTPSRIDHLEKIFKHYCSYIFKAGKHVTFDRIVYENEHLIMERFFIFLNDFKVNTIYVDSQPKQLIPKNEIILAFKKSSGNSRNLQFSQFMSCVERVAVLHYDFQQGYEQRKKKAEQERQKIKQINLRRLMKKQMKQKKLEQQQRALQEQALKRAMAEAQIQNQKNSQQGLEQSNNQESIDTKQQTLQERKQRKKKDKKDKKKKKKKKGAKSEIDDQSQANNDELMNQIAKDVQLENPNEDFQILNKFKEKQASIDPMQKERKQKQMQTLIKQEKIQLFYKLIQLDDLKSVLSKLRPFEKSPYKPKKEQNLMQNQSSMSKLRETQLKNILRLGELKQKIKTRKVQKLKSSMSQSISDEKYIEKRKQDYQKYLNKALGIKNNNQDTDAENQKLKYPYKRKDQSVMISLDMLNHASVDTFRLKNNPKRYLVPQKEDELYMNEYGGYQSRRMRSSSTAFNGSSMNNSPRNNSIEILKKLKKRTNQLEEVQKKSDEKQLNRFAVQMYKNQNYLKKMAERKQQ